MGLLLSLENSECSCLCFRLALLHSVFYFFFLCRLPSTSLCSVFDAISGNLFVIGDFNVHHNDWLTYSVGTGRPVEIL